jgi:hypothetical protein
MTKKQKKILYQILILIYNDIENLQKSQLSNRINDIIKNLE